MAERTDDVDGLIAAHNALGAIAEAALELDRAERHAIRVPADRPCRSAMSMARPPPAAAWESLPTCVATPTAPSTTTPAPQPHYEAAEALSASSGTRCSSPSALSNLAQARLRLGDRSGSLAACREAMADLAGLGATSPLIFCLLVEADWRLTAGDTERALALLGLVQAHPVAVRNDHDEIKRIVSRTSLDQIAIERGMTAGARSPRRGGGRAPGRAARLIMRRRRDERRSSP